MTLGPEGMLTHADNKEMTGSMYILLTLCFNIILPYCSGGRGGTSIQSREQFLTVG